MKPYVKENIIQKPLLENVNLKGYVKDIMNIFFENRIFSDYAKNVVYKEAEDAFRNCVDDKEAILFWQGEFWGKWVISAARVYKYNKDEKLKEFLHNAALTLIGLQREDGYIGTYKNSRNVVASDPKETEKIVGWPCDYNWNIWCRKYVLWGLLECYEITGDDKILNAAVRMTDHLIKELDEDGLRLVETGTACFSGLPPCSILKPMLILYRLTENKKYLDFCMEIIKDWEKEDVKPALLYHLLNKKPLADWYLLEEFRAKAYEMMSCLDGVLELYRVTGDEKYLTAIKNFYDIAIEHELNPVLTVGFNDTFMNAKYNINGITEPCDIIHWMRVCHELFVLTGDVKYMDSFELAFYNSFLASSYKDGKWGARGARSHGRHYSGESQSHLLYNHCCVNNMPRGYMNMAETVAMTDENAVYINFYSEYDVTLPNGTKIAVEGDYLAESNAKITVDFGEGEICEIKLRIPAWSDKNEVRFGGKTYNPESGYFSVMPEDKVVEIEVIFDNQIKMVEVDAFKDVETTPALIKIFVCDYTNTFCPQELMIYDNRFTLRKGVMLLCRTKLIGNTEEEMFGDKTIDSSYKMTYKKCEPHKDIYSEYEVTFDNGSDKVVTHVCDYATGTNVHSAEDTKMFNIYF